MKHRRYRPSREIGISPRNFASHKFMLGGKLISSRIFRYNQQHTLSSSNSESPITLLSCHNKILPKAQRIRGLSSGYQSNFFRSYHKFSSVSLSDFIFICSTKQQFQNLNQISAFQLNLNLNLTKRSF